MFPRTFTIRRNANQQQSDSTERLLKGNTPLSVPLAPLTSGSSLAEGDSYFHRVLQRVYQTIERNDIRLAEHDKRESIRLEWEQVAQITDRFLLFWFVLATLTITGIVLFWSPASVDVEDLR